MLQTLLIFTLLNFISYGDLIDVSKLVSYDGEVKYYDLESNRIVDRVPRIKTNLSCVSVLLEPTDIRESKETHGCYFILPKTLSQGNQLKEIDTHGCDPWYYRSHSATVYSSMRSRPKSFFPWNST